MKRHQIIFVLLIFSISPTFYTVGNNKNNKKSSTSRQKTKPNNNNVSTQIQKKILPELNTKTLITALSMGLFSGACWAEYDGLKEMPSTQHFLGKMLIEYPLSSISEGLFDSKYQFGFSCTYFVASQIGYYLSQYVENAF